MLIAIVLLAILFTLGFANTVLKPSIKGISSWLQSLTTKPHAEELVLSSKTENRRDGPRDPGELRMVFATFDKNGDGFVTKQELRESFDKIGVRMSESEIEDMFEKSDSNGDGLIEFHEFRDLCESVMDGGIAAAEGEEEGLREAFDVFDGDKDGMISVEELRVALSNLGMREGGRLDSCKEMIRKVDMDGDGMVSFDEFKVMMKSRGKCLPVS